MDRAGMLDAVRRGLRRGPLPPDAAAALDARLRTPPRHLIPARVALPHADLVALFAAFVEREFGTTEHVATAADVPAAMAAHLARENLPAAFAMAPDPALRALPWATRPMLDIREGRADPGDTVSLTLALAGIAETGTLLLPSGPRTPTTLNLLPDTAVVLLPTSRIVGPYEDAWDLLRAQNAAERGGRMPRATMLVTGPSRSADIEQTLELGAHGPRRLHVLLLDGPLPA